MFPPPDKALLFTIRALPRLLSPEQHTELPSLRAMWKGRALGTWLLLACVAVAKLGVHGKSQRHWVLPTDCCLVGHRGRGDGKGAKEAVLCFFFTWFSLGMFVSAVTLHVFFSLAVWVLLLTLFLRETFHSLLECLSRSGSLLPMCSVCRVRLTCMQTERSPGRCLVPVSFPSEGDWIYTLELH